MRRRWVIFGAVLVLAVLAGPALAKPKPPKPKPPPPRNTTSTLAPTTTVEPTTTTVEPTTTTEAPTTTRAVITLDGNAPVTDQGVIIYGNEFDGLPIPGGDPPAVRLCPSGTALDFEASTFELSAGLHVEYFADFGTVIVLAELDTTGTVTYHLVCR